MSVHLSSWGRTEAPKAFAEAAQAACKYFTIFPPIQETGEALFDFSGQIAIAFLKGNLCIHTEGWHSFQSLMLQVCVQTRPRRVTVQLLGGEVIFS